MAADIFVNVPTYVMALFQEAPLAWLVIGSVLLFTWKYKL